jgi:hypothetical protein
MELLYSSQKPLPKDISGRGLWLRRMGLGRVELPTSRLSDRNRASTCADPRLFSSLYIVTSPTDVSQR